MSAGPIKSVKPAPAPLDTADRLLELISDHVLGL